MHYHYDTGLSAPKVGALIFLLLHGGSFFFIVSWFLCSALSYMGIPTVIGRHLHFDSSLVDKLIPLAAQRDRIEIGQEIAVWAVSSMFLSFFSGLLVKCWFEKPSRKHAALVNSAKGNPIEELLIEASFTAFSVKITMRTKKVYVGIVMKPALEHGKLEYVSVIPLLSGCRSDGEHRVHFYTNYYNHYENSGVYAGISALNLEHYRVVLPVSEIDNISLFDITTYINFNKKTQDPTRLEIQE
ncbi:hypothetical protein [Kluyvera intermedia]|uniref:hypothetical protein n=1 Tax=Kluyvera intermedia TaxID=61648 RepID=UPI0035238580